MMGPSSLRCNGTLRRALRCRQPTFRAVFVSSQCNIDAVMQVIDCGKQWCPALVVKMRGTREAPGCRGAASGSQHVDVLLAQLRGDRSPGPDCPRPNSHLTARETKCSDCGHRLRQSASSNPPAKSPKNHIIDDVFTQPGPSRTWAHGCAGLLAALHSSLPQSIYIAHSLIRINVASFGGEMVNCVGRTSPTSEIGSSWH
jgi:hypothetical protein